MANINEILQRAASLRDETALNSISPERAGGIMYDTLIALNELWLQQGSALVISKIYASVSAMEADTAPVSDLTGQPLRPGQIVVIASSDSDNGTVYRYNGTTSPSWTSVGKIGNLEPVDSLDSDSTSLPLAAHQGKVLDGKISQLGQELFNIKNCTLDKAYQYAVLIDAPGYCVSGLLQINVQNGDAVEWGVNALKTDTPIVSIVWFDENKRRIETWDSGANANVDGVYTRNYSYDTTAKFAYVSGKYNANNPPYFKVNGNLVWVAVAEDGVVEKLNKDIHTEKLHKISISEWNIGKCNEGLSPQGIPDEDMDEKVPQLKKLLTTICSDIFFVNECPLYLNQGNSGATQQNFYDAVLKQFYPFYSDYDQTTELRIFSKYPLISVVKYDVTLPSSYTRSYIAGEFLINNKRIGICVLHAPVVGGATNAPTDRIAYFEDIVGRFSSYDYVIIAGDTNIGNDAESESLIAEQIAVFIDAGYSLSNRGYWGVISTYNPLVSWQALDNIIVRGFNIDNFIVEDEKIVSDHFPIQSKISSLI